MGGLNSKISPSPEMLPATEQGDGSFHDPRSPTPYINRSPISQESGTLRAPITKVKDLSAELEVPFAHTPNNLLPKRFQSIVDPRSPTTFTRTPLVVDPSSVEDCSLTTVVSSLQYDDCSIVHEDDIVEASFQDCDPQIPEMCHLQIEYDDSAPIIDQTEEDEATVFEDAEVAPFAANDPRSPSIAILRTPIVLVEDDDENINADGNQVENVIELTRQAVATVETQQRTPEQGIQDFGARGEQTPKKDKLTPTAAKSGQRTPLGCMTNIGTVSNIRKMALMGQMKQTMVGDEQKLLSRSGISSSAESNTSSKNINRSRIPKLRLS